MRACVCLIWTLIRTSVKAKFTGSVCFRLKTQATEATSYKETARPPATRPPPPLGPHRWEHRKRVSSLAILGSRDHGVSSVHHHHLLRISLREYQLFSSKAPCR